MPGVYLDAKDIMISEIDRIPIFIGEETKAQKRILVSWSYSQGEGK